MTPLVLPAVLMHAQAPACSRMLAQAVRSDRQSQARVDASALQRFDSSALAVLLECRREALALGKTFAVQAMPPQLLQLAALYGVEALLPN